MFALGCLWMDRLSGQQLFGKMFAPRSNELQRRIMEIQEQEHGEGRRRADERRSYGPPDYVSEGSSSAARRASEGSSSAGRRASEGSSSAGRRASESSSAIAEGISSGKAWSRSPESGEC